MSSVNPTIDCCYFQANLIYRDGPFNIKQSKVDMFLRNEITIPEIYIVSILHPIGSRLPITVSLKRNNS